MRCCAERLVWTEVEVANSNALLRLPVSTSLAHLSLKDCRDSIGGMMSETFAKGELLPIVTKEVGHDRRGRDGVGVSEKEVRKE